MPSTGTVIENILLSGYLREHENEYGQIIPNLVQKALVSFLKQYSLYQISSSFSAAETSFTDISTVDSLKMLDQGPFSRNLRSIPSLPDLPGNDKIVDVQMGHQHSLFLTEHGKVYAMGSNDSGQCGVDVPFTKVPMLIPFDGNIKISAIACGKLHSLFLDENGRLLVCGYNYCGQLGLDNGSSDNLESAECAPLALALVGFDTPDTDNSDSDSDSAPFADAWGQAMGFQDVGFQDTFQDTFQEVMQYETEDTDSVHSVQAVQFEDQHLKELPLESAYFYQRLETVDKPIYNHYFDDLGITFSSIHCGAYHSLCITTKGECYTFGHNGFGNLGNGTYTQWGEGECTPYKLETTHTFVDASCGSDHNVLVTDENQIISFGDNTCGQCSKRHSVAKVTKPMTLSKMNEFGLPENYYVEKVLASERQTLVVVDAYKRVCSL